MVPEQKRHRLDVATNSLGFLGVLPTEIVQHILQFLGPKELLRRVLPLNRHMNQLAHDNALWKALCMKHIPSHPVEMQFWFLKRVEKEALLNRTTVSGALCHSRHNTARHPDRGNNSSISTLSSTSSSSLQAKVLDGGDPADHEFGAYDGEADGDYQNGDQTDDDNRRNDDAGTEDDDQEERDHERAANMVMLRHRGAAGPAPMTCTTTSSDARDKDKDNRKKPHPFLREESDKSFLWSRGGWSSTGGSSDPAPNLECGWQGVFRKYHQLERNWKKGNCAVKTLVSRRRVYCILFSEEKQLLWSGNAKGTVVDDKAAGLDPLRSAARNQGARLGNQLPADARELQQFVGRR